MTFRALVPLLLVLLVACCGGKELAVDEPEAAPPPPLAAPALPQPAAIGQPAPDFDLRSTEGGRVKLSQYSGRVVVLEWINPDCPFVRWAHGQGPLQKMAANYRTLGVVWLAINSSGYGRQGHGMARNQKAVQEFGLLHPILLDEDGEVGRLYSASRTPQAALIDRKGLLVYNGGIDNLPMGEMARPNEQPTAYLDNAISAVLAGQPVPVASAPTWGCSVKYANGGARH